MMNLHKLTAGDGYTYLTRQVAANDATQRGYGSLGEYYAQKGEAPGVWMGRGLAAMPKIPELGTTQARPGRAVTEPQMLALFGHGYHPDSQAIAALLRASGHHDSAVGPATKLGLAFKTYDGATHYRTQVAAALSQHNRQHGLPSDWPVPADERAKIRTDVARHMFFEQYGRAPTDPRELSGFIARTSRQATSAVAGYDLTFSPVKSVSALWALAPLELARQVEQAHHDAVADVLAWLEDNAVYTRSGHRSAQQVDVHGLIAAAFTHRDSRAGDPDLHTHVAISNKVQALDGRWLAVDGRPLHKMTVAASERYNTRLEALLVERLGLRFNDRLGTDPGKRTVREICGVDPRLLSRWSARRQAIDVRRGELAAAFQSEHGRTPTAVEALHLAQQATFETRQAKHDPRSLAQQRTAWRAEAADSLGDAAAIEQMLRTIRLAGSGMAPPNLDRDWVEAIAVRVLRTIQAERATWQEPQVRAEAERVARAERVPLSRLDETVGAVVACALSPLHSIRLSALDPVDEPAVLRRRDGTSVYVAAGTVLYSSSDVLEAEEQLVAAALREGGRVVTPATLDLTLAELIAHGIELNAGQERLVRELASSGRRLQLVLAPAGTGKTTALGVLAQAWVTAVDAPGGTVVGLAPSAAAASVLRDEFRSAGIAHTDTIAKLLWSIGPGRAASGQLPAWVQAMDERTLVMIDEAGMAATTDLAEVVSFALERGASVRLIGDDQQLAAIGAGGVLRDIARKTSAVTLSEVVRFSNPASGRAEAAASIALRDGDDTALAFYADQGRVHVGDLSTVTAEAYRAWSNDDAGGRDAIMLASTRDVVTALNRRARDERLARDEPNVLSRSEVNLADGACASDGDVVVCRSNNRRLSISPTDWVKNGDRFRIIEVRGNGGLRVVHLATGYQVDLPAGYVAEHVRLGYAATVHAAQGITAERCHLVVTGSESRQLLYVGVTRGRDANHLYVASAPDGDPHSVISRDALLPPTALEILSRVLARDGAPSSATTTLHEGAEPRRRLAEAATRYYDSLGVAAEHHLGEAGLASLDAIVATAIPSLIDQPAYPTLRRSLALTMLNGADPDVVLHEAISERELGSAQDLSAVLSWRVDPTRAGIIGPLPWLPAVPAQLTTDPYWGAYLAGLQDWVLSTAAQVATETIAWTPSDTPGWALPFVAHPGLVSDLAVWRAAVCVEDDDQTPTGPTQQLAAESAHQSALKERVERVLGKPESPAARWLGAAEAIEPRIVGDAYWPLIAQRLTSADQSGFDVPSLLLAAAATGPLPDEQPAAALWWRIVQHLPRTPVAVAEAKPAPAASQDVAALADAVRPGSSGLSIGEKLDAVFDFDRYALSGEDWADAYVDAHKWETAAVGRDRLVDLNRQTFDYYNSLFMASWAPKYLLDRLGSDMQGDTRFPVGYAPPGWNHLVDHLRRRGATDVELAGAGLAKRSSSGRLYDVFRDRLVFPIQADGEVVGFIGRRNPSLDEHEDAPPKYLNTAATDLFTKGDHVYGLPDVPTGQDRSTLVLVEGPLDAIAISLAGEGDFVGVAPLGTALSATQADKLRPWIHPNSQGVIVATDPDSAGRAAAERDYWMLTARGDVPRHLALPDGLDPAGYYGSEGAIALHAALRQSDTLARDLVDRHLTGFEQPEALRRVVGVIAALPPIQWPEHIAQVRSRIGASADMLPIDVLSEAYRRTAAQTSISGARLLGHTEPTTSRRQTDPLATPTNETIQPLGMRRHRSI